MNRNLFRGVGFLLVLVLPFGLGQAKAEDVTLSWTNPTRTFTLQDAGPLTNLAGTKIYMEVADTSDPNATSFTIPGLKPGTYKFVAVSYDANGVASPVSGVATMEVTQFVTTGEVAYTVLRVNDEFRMLAVGSISLGVACDSNQQILGKYVVPRTAVTWYGTVKPQAVIADCG